MTLYSRLQKRNNSSKILNNTDFLKRLSRTKFDLNEEILGDDGYVFLVEVSGNSMINIGINSGDKVLVNSNYPISNESIVVGALNGKPFVKRILFTDDRTILHSENEDYEDIRITDLDEFSIWGVVRNVIREF
ncbi:MAG: peptidase S24 [Ignavibacteriae bacterium HGW-Ignavibacteriae-4]|nr:MAG: peptidase S24 [Ignavibacteriae bacterium HGW-Ignavibacteriae-4]